MYSQLPLNALRAFEAVARLKSFQAAAAELHVTPSAISHQMRQLENWAGRKLVERKIDGIIVLPQGELLSQTLSAALTDIASASRRIKQPQAGEQLVIAVIPSVATCWLIPKLTEFRQDHPGIRIRVVYAIHGQPIDFDDVDVAITYSSTPLKPQAGVVTRKLLAGDSAPVCSAAFLELHGPLDTPDAIMAAGLLHDTDMRGWRRWLGLAGAGDDLPPEGPVFEDFNLLRAATLAGQGISICPLAIIHDDLAEARLHQLSGLTILAESGYYTLHGESGRDGTETARGLFLRWLRHCAAAQS